MILEFILGLSSAAVGLCLAGGGFGFVLLCWFAFTRRGHAAALRLLNVSEYRCHKCRDAAGCPACDSGVAYPCGHYKPEDKPV